jgi:predicted ribosome quality control (RQC) complex YloA/Tae2 family protein
LGYFAGTNLTTGDNNIDIGNRGVAGEAGTIRIGTEGTQTHAYLAGVYQTNIANGLVVKVDSSGHLGTVGSSERFKDSIKPMDKASEAILALKPVTFHYKKEFDPEGIPQFGLVAEQVEKVNPDLVIRDAKGEVYSVRYEAVNAMLLNEFLKEHRKTQKLEATVAKQQKQIEALTTGLQKVSDQLELSKPAPQLVGNNQ